MSADLQKFLIDLKAICDKARVTVDAADAALTKLDSSILGELAQKFPVIGPDLTLVIGAASMLTSVVDGIDDLVDKLDTVPAK